MLYAVCALFSDTLRGVLSRCNILCKLLPRLRGLVVKAQHVGPMLSALTCYVDDNRTIELLMNSYVKGLQMKK